MAGTYKVNNDRLTGLTVYSTLPVGTVIASFTNSEVGFLPCDHSEYNQSDFPELYAKLQNIPQCQSENEGKFYVPDLRESNLVGVGTSDNTDIASHDTYVVGEFKDDQFQGHSHKIQYYDYANINGGGTARALRNETPYNINSSDLINGIISDGTNGDPRTGSTTHGKQTGVYYLIKATDYASLPQNAIDDTRVTNANTWSAEKIESKFEYSTEEKVIGTWIDGKPIYRKVLNITNPVALDQVIPCPNIDTLIAYGGKASFNIGSIVTRNFPWIVGSYISSFNGWNENGLIYYGSHDSGALTMQTGIIWVEYTKTTD